MTVQLKPKTLIIALFLIFNGIMLQAQTALEILTSKDIPVTWLGIDYSHAKYYGMPDFRLSAMKAGFSSINDLVIVEPAKFDIGKYMNKTTVEKKIKTIQNLNAAIDSTKIMLPLDAKHEISSESIKNIVKAYQFPEELKGVGLVFIAETLNKAEVNGHYWIVYLNIENNSVIMAEKITGKPAGFGFRNYWAGSFNNAMKSIKSTYNDYWKKKYKLSSN